MAGEGTPGAKAEAVRRAIRERVRLEDLDEWPLHDDADSVLAKGYGTSADLALLAVVMLREVGVEAAPAAIRRRSGGSVPSEFPIPGLFDDLLVRFTDGPAKRYFSPASDLPVGRLPWDCHRVLVASYDGKSEKPDEIPDFTSADLRIELSDWPPGERSLPVDLDAAYDETDTLTLRLPPEVAQAALPGPAKFDAGAVGIYESSFEGKAGVLTAKRHMRLDRYSFAPQAYPRLRLWFVEIAKGDEATITLTAK